MSSPAIVVSSTSHAHDARHPGRLAEICRPKSAQHSAQCQEATEYRFPIGRYFARVGRRGRQWARRISPGASCLSPDWPADRSHGERAEIRRGRDPAPASGHSLLRRTAVLFLRHRRRHTLHRLHLAIYTKSFVRLEHLLSGPYCPLPFQPSDCLSPSHS